MHTLYTVLSYNTDVVQCIAKIKGNRNQQCDQKQTNIKMLQLTHLCPIGEGPKMKGGVMGL